MDLPVRKFYIRHREGVPESELHDHAKRGFWTLGAETGAYDWIDGINDLTDLGPEVGLAGYVGDIHRALQVLGKPVPAFNDYPEPLTEFLGRGVWRGTLGEVKASSAQVFVKPVEGKLFNGFVWEGSHDPVSRRRVVTHHDDAEVWLSEPVTFRAEFRAFVLYDKVIDCRRYKGDWDVAPDRAVVEAGVKAMKRGKASYHAYCLDWGVTDDGRTLLVEMNDGYSFGHYGLPPASYARMLATRWHQLTV